MQCLLVQSDLIYLFLRSVLDPAGLFYTARCSLHRIKDVFAHEEAQTLLLSRVITIISSSNSLGVLKSAEGLWRRTNRLCWRECSVTDVRFVFYFLIRRFLGEGSTNVRSEGMNVLTTLGYETENTFLTFTLTAVKHLPRCSITPVSRWKLLKITITFQLAFMSQAKHKCI